MTLTIIVPAYNEEGHIRTCLDSIIESAGGRLTDLIVVDNGSTDGTGEIARQHQGVRVIRTERKGLTYARECGRLEAKSELIAYVDADCRISRDWIDVAEQIFEEQPHTVSLSGPATYFDASRWQNAVLSACWRGAAPPMYFLVGYMLFGAGFVVRKRALDAVGGFNTAIQFYGEDTDLARRLSLVGKVLFRMDFRTATSARRFRTEGIIKTNATYAINYLWPVLFNRPFSTAHNDIR